jgi:hypothetical protein
MEAIPNKKMKAFIDMWKSALDDDPAMGGELILEGSFGIDKDGELEIGGTAHIPLASPAVDIGVGAGIERQWEKTGAGRYRSRLYRDPLPPLMTFNYDNGVVTPGPVKTGEPEHE